MDNRDSADQARVIAFLSNPEAYVPEPATVERITTHAAMVFLAGDNAYKVKRAVKLPYLDFSTLEKRHATCVHEFQINSVNAPSIYLGVVPVTQGPEAKLSLGGTGPAVEWAVHMRRFPAGKLLSNMYSETEPPERAVRDLAEMIVDLHQRAPVAVTSDGPDRIAEIIEELGQAFTGREHLGSASVADQLKALCRREFGKVRRCLKFRSEHGCLRRCHGDLHLGNIVEIDGKPRAFDAIEFDDRMATIDVLYDLAFLIMDLEVRGYRRAANLLLNRYIGLRGQTLDLQGLAALPLFLALRAAIRAMVALQRQPHEPLAKAEAQAYLSHALTYFAPDGPRLIAIGGCSGTGKSTVARLLAPSVGRSPGAIHISSDQTRKELAGVQETTRLGAAGYSPEVSAAVYGRLHKTASHVLRSGYSVVVDATFISTPEQIAIEALARTRNLAFTGLWLTVDQPVAEARVLGRTGDVSDASAEIVRQQFARAKPPANWICVDANGTMAQTLDTAKRRIFGSA